MTRLLAVLAATAVLGGVGGAVAGHAATDTTPGCTALVNGAGVVVGTKGWSDPYPGTTWKRSYCLHLPAGASSTDDLALVVVLHGCTTWAPTAAYETQFNAEADRERFAVLYPQQSANFSSDGPGAHAVDGNGSYCWNWFLPDQLQRDSPEPWMLNDIVSHVVAGHDFDRRRIYVIGLSAGAAEANNLAVLYPEVFAAVGVVAGGEYEGAPCFGSHSALPPQASAELAYQASAGHARPVPFLVENGDADPVVPVQNAYDDVVQWQTYAQLAGGEAPVASAPCAVTNSPDLAAGAPAVAYPYTTFYYSRDGAACAPSAQDFGRLMVVHGMSHMYPGGAPRREYTTEDGYWDIWSDPLGPNLTDMAWQFFAAHPCHLVKGACA